MKKRIMVMVMLGCMVLTATGCGSKSSAKTAKTAGTGAAVFNGKLESNVKIRVLENDTAISKGYFKELIDAFNEKYKDKGIEAVDANMDQYLDLANDGPYGYGPDVLYQANDVIMKYA